MSRISLIIATSLFSATLSLAATDTPVTSLTSSSTIEEIRTELQSMRMPLLEFNLKEGAFPSCTPIDHPAGCVGTSITDNEYVEGSLTITAGGTALYESGDYVKGASGVRLKVRGNTSAVLRPYKMGYKIKLSKKADLMCRDDKSFRDKNWVLLGVTENTKSPAAHELGRRLGLGWQPEMQPVNLIINDRYMGMYFLYEAVGAGEKRVNLDDSGFLIENDPYWWKEKEGEYFKSSHQPYAMGWTFKEPDTDDFTENTVSNIRDVIESVENTLYNGQDVSGKMDLQSFAGWMLAMDILGATDGMGTNIFVMKKDLVPSTPFSTLIETGPLWDFDSARLAANGDWANVHTGNYYYMPELFRQRKFVQSYKEQWEACKENVTGWIDDYHNSFKEQWPDFDKARYIDLTLVVNPGLRALGKGEMDYWDLDEDRTDWHDYLSERLPALDNMISAIALPDVNPAALNPLGADALCPESSCRYFDITGRDITGHSDIHGVVIRLAPDGTATRILR